MGIHLVLVCFCFFVFYLTFNYDIELSILEKPRKNTTITTKNLRQQNYIQQPKTANNIKNTSQNSSEKVSSLDQGLYNY